LTSPIKLKTKKKEIKLLMFLAIMVFFLQGEQKLSYAANRFDPSLKWQTIETQHFNIHFHQGEEEIAQECAEIAEDVHKKLLDFLDYKPKKRVSIVIADNDDRAGGFATPFPNNTIYITPTHPHPMLVGSRFTNWLRFVITHEYTHIVHLDMVRGFPGFIRKVFGRVPNVAFPNELQPLWLIEGLAVYEETSLTEGGRGEEPFFDMILRMAVLEDKFNSLDQIGAPSLQTFPGGIVPYLYGVSICQYIAEKYGKDKLREIAHNYSGSLPYFFILGVLPGYAHIYVNLNRAIKKAIGIDSYQLFREWKEALKKQYAEKVKANSAKSKELTKRGYFISNPTWSPDGKQIAYFEKNNESYPSLRIMKEDGSEDKKLVECDFASYGLGFSPEGDEIVYSELTYHKNFSIYSDLFIYDRDTKKKKRLTRALRAKDPGFLPDGERIIFVANEAGRNNLAVMDLADSKITYLTDYKDRIQYYTPLFSPDGSRVVFSRWKDGFQDICLADQDGRNITPIIQDKAMDIDPSWSPDGKYIFFSSDRSGIFNIYAFSIKERKLYQVTDVIGGTFDPSVSPDGKKIAFPSYSSRGYDIHLMDVNTEDWKEISVEATSSEAKASTVKKIPNYQAHPYNPLPTLFPKFWIPIISVNQTIYSDGEKSETSLGGLGFATLGWDVLDEHHFDLFSIYDFEDKKIRFSLNYQNDQLYPTIGVGLSEKGINWASLTFLIRRGIRSEQSASVIGFHGGFETIWNYTNAQKYGFSISPTNGRSVSVSYKKEAGTWGSSFDNDEVVADWREYLKLPFKNQVLALRLVGGVSERLISVGGEMGTEDIVIGGALFPLRGYPDWYLEGEKAVVASIEYRFPIKNIERGWRVFPLFFDRLHGAIFADCGNVWNEDAKWSSFKLGAGAELRLDIHRLYFFPWTNRLGVAYGFDEGGETRIYFGSGLSF